jgi:hypothetical protein
VPLQGRSPSHHLLLSRKDLEGSRLRRSGGIFVAQQKREALESAKRRLDSTDSLAPVHGRPQDVPSSHGS